MGSKTELLWTLAAAVSVESAAVGDRSFAMNWRATCEQIWALRTECAAPITDRSGDRFPPGLVAGECLACPAEFRGAAFGPRMRDKQAGLACTIPRIDTHQGQHSIPKSTWNGVKATLLSGRYSRLAASTYPRPGHRLTLRPDPSRYRGQASCGQSCFRAFALTWIMASTAAQSI